MEKEYPVYNTKSDGTLDFSGSTSIYRP